MTLEEGDLILTGTPEGVGMVRWASQPASMSSFADLSASSDGDKITAALETTDGNELLSWKGQAAARVGGYEYKAGTAAKKLAKEISDVFERPDRLDAASA